METIALILGTTDEVCERCQTAYQEVIVGKHHLCKKCLVKLVDAARDMDKFLTVPKKA